MLFIFASQLTFAAEQPENKIEYNTPEKFTDFSSDENRNARDREKLMKQLTGLMKESIAKRSKYTFEIMVNDIDMTGRMELTKSGFIRIVEDFDRTRFEFKYQMFDSSGKMVKQGDVNLSDRNPHSLQKRSIKYKNSLFGNEMILFNDWLESL